MTGPAGEWAISDEFAQRLGCGALTAAVLPLWFLLLVFVVESTVALYFAVSAFVVTAVVAVLAVRRNRRLPRRLRIEDGALITESRAGRVRRPLDALRRVEIGTSLGVWPVELVFADGATLRLPRQITASARPGRRGGSGGQDGSVTADGFDDFIGALRAVQPDLIVIDRNPDDAESSPGSSPGSSR